MINITAYSALDLIEMLAKMKKEGRVTELEIRMISGLIARYTFLQDKYEDDDE